MAGRRSSAWPLRGAQRRGTPRPHAQAPWTRCLAGARAGEKGKGAPAGSRMAQHSAHRPRTPTGAAKASRQHSGTSRCQLTFSPHWRTSNVTESAARRRTAERRLARRGKGAPAGDQHECAQAETVQRCRQRPHSGCTHSDVAEMTRREGSAAWDGAEAASPARRHGSPGISARVSKAGRAQAARARPYHAGQSEGKVNEKPQRSSKASDHVRN